MNQLRAIALVLVWPMRGLPMVLAEPRALFAILFIASAFLASHWALHHRLDLEAQERLIAAESKSDASEQEITDQAKRALAMRRIGGYAGYAASVPLAALAGGALLYLLALGFQRNKAAQNGRISFGRAFALFSHAALPLGLRELLAIPVLLSYRAIDPSKTAGLFKTDLGSLWPGLSFPGAFLVDPFCLWAGTLVGLSVRAAGKPRFLAALAGIAFFVLFGFLGRVLP